MWGKVLQKVRDKRPRVHCITNYVTANDCANALLSLGASPIMADYSGEAEEITAACSALCINMGTINADRAEAMIRSGMRANELGLPVILDPVGVGGSEMRKKTVKRLLENVRFAVIRGNISEIKTLALGVGGAGIDADLKDKITEDNLKEALGFLQSFSQKTGAVIMATGETDYIVGEGRACAVKNGSAKMSLITGGGCMLSALTAAFAASHGDMFEAASAAAVFWGICGERAADRMKDSDGSGSFRAHLIDAVGTVSELDTDKMAKTQLYDLKEGARCI